MSSLCLIFVISVFICGVFPCNFAVKMYCPINNNRSKILSVLVFFLLPSVMRSFVKLTLLQSIKLVLHIKSLVSVLDNPKSCVGLVQFHLHSYRENNLESLLIFVKHKKIPSAQSA